MIGTPTVYIARRINGPDHTFLGLAVGLIDLRYITDFYQAIKLPPGETVTLLRSDGLVLVRYPDPTNQVGKWMPAASPWYQLVAGQGGTYRSPGYLAPQSSVVSVNKLRTWPLVIDVSMMESVALAKWRRQATVIALGASALHRIRRAVRRHRPAVPPPGGAECEARADGGSLARQRGPGAGFRRDVVRLVVGNRRRICASPGYPTARRSA